MTFTVVNANWVAVVVVDHERGMQPAEARGTHLQFVAYSRMQATC